MVISILTIETCEKAYISSAIKNSLLLLFAFNIFLFKYILCIYYLLYFRKDQVKIQALIDFGSKFNAMISVYVERLKLKAQSINIKAQIINSSNFQTFKIIFASF